MRDRTVIVPSPCRFKLIRIVYGRAYEIQNNTRHGHATKSSHFESFVLMPK